MFFLVWNCSRCLNIGLYTDLLVWFFFRVCVVWSPSCEWIQGSHNCVMWRWRRAGLLRLIPTFSMVSGRQRTRDLITDGKMCASSSTLPSPSKQHGHSHLDLSRCGVLEPDRLKRCTQRHPWWSNPDTQQQTIRIFFAVICESRQFCLPHLIVLII